NVPGGIDLDKGYTVAEYRRTVFLTAHHHPHSENLVPVFIGPEAVVGDVHPQMALAQVPGKPAPEFQVQSDLADAIRHRNPQLPQSSQVGLSGGIKPVAGLEFPECIAQSGG